MGKTTEKPWEENKELTAIPESVSETLGITNPDTVVKLAAQIQEYVVSQELTVIIQKEPYVMVEGWQFAGSLLGLVAKATSYKNDSIYQPVTFKWKVWDKQKNRWIEKSHTARGIYKYFAEAVAVNAQGREVAHGFAMCTNEEVKKHKFDEYSILSMAQTRAVGKAMRLAISFLMRAAGYKPTPAEEMADAESETIMPEGTNVASIPEDVENQILIFTDAESLSDWANKQTQYHTNIDFVDKVKQQIRKLNDGKRKSTTKK